MKDFEIRRIFIRKEAAEIKALQSGAPEFAAHYPQHDKWLDMAIDEIAEGKRIAFGVFTLAFSEDQQPIVTLAGSIILKKSLFSRSAELKNLFIKNDCRTRSYGRALFNAVEEYCCRSGFSAIKTEVPAAEFGTVAFLHKMGFRVTDTLESPYAPGEHLYRMSKSLAVYYDGDWFDSFALALWILEHVYPFDNVRTTGSMIDFVISPRHVLPATQTSDSAVRGTAIVLDEETQQLESELQQSVRNLNCDLVFVFGSLSDGLKRLLSGHRPVVITKEFISDAFASRLAFKPAGFSKKDIAGMIVSMNPEYFCRIGSRKTTFSYFKAGPVGKYLLPGHHVLIFCEPTPAYPTGGIQGFGLVRQVVVGRPDDVWTHLRNQQPVLSETEYQSYTREKDNVLGIVIDEFAEVDPIDFQTVIRKITMEDVDMVSLGHRYLSGQMLGRFLRLARKTKAATENEYDVALSFAGEDRKHAEGLASILDRLGVKVFYDRYETADLWGKNLYEHLQTVYRDKARYCVVFLSQAYSQKLWTRHELQQAQARAFRENQEYILPVRLDQTQIPGINETIGYIDLNEYSLEAIAQMLREKLSLRS